MSKPQLFVKITNETDTDINQNRWEINFRNEKCSSSCHESVPAHSSVMMPLPTDQTSYGFAVRKKGITWKRTKEEKEALKLEPNRYEDTITVVPGGEYFIVVNEENPPLAPDSHDKISKVVVDCLEEGVSNVWKTVAKRLPEIAGNRTEEQLNEVYDCDRKVWTEWYNPPTVVDIDPIIPKEGPFRVDMYWRALDRFPGGNADIHTLCMRFVSNGVVYAIHHYNWDGSHSKEAYQPEFAKNNPLEQVVKLLSEFKGPKNSEYTVVDTISSDSEEYDTEWSSIEVLVYSPIPWNPNTHKQFSEQKRTEIRTFLLVNQRLGKKLSKDELQHLFNFVVADEPWKARFRLHQKGIHGEQWWGRPKRTKREDVHVEPTPEQKSLMTGMNELVGMGRVNQFTDAGDGEDPCRASKEMHSARKIRLPLSSDLPYLNPLYFRHEVRSFDAPENEEDESCSEEDE